MTGLGAPNNPWKRSPKAQRDRASSAVNRRMWYSERGMPLGEPPLLFWGLFWFQACGRFSLLFCFDKFCLFGFGTRLKSVWKPDNVCLGACTKFPCRLHATTKILIGQPLFNFHILQPFVSKLSTVNAKRLFEVQALVGQAVELPMRLLNVGGLSNLRSLRNRGERLHNLVLYFSVNGFA